jgi:hypothetical protein
LVEKIMKASSVKLRVVWNGLIYENVALKNISSITKLPEKLVTVEKNIYGNETEETLYPKVAVKFIRASLFTEYRPVTYNLNYLFDVDELNKEFHKMSWRNRFYDIVKIDHSSFESPLTVVEIAQKVKLEKILELVANEETFTFIPNSSRDGVAYIGLIYLVLLIFSTGVYLFIL